MSPAPDLNKQHMRSDQEVFAALGNTPPIGLILNPSSRRCTAHLAEINQLICAFGQIHAKVTDNEAEIPATLTTFASRSVKILAICGGDGTVSKVLSHLMNNRPFVDMPLIAILPGGTANMTAGDVGFRGHLVSALARLLVWVENKGGSAELIRRPILKVTSRPDEPPQYGMFFGAGAIVQGIEYTNANIHSRGLKHELSLGLGLARSIFGIVTQDPRFVQPIEMTITNGSAKEITQNVLLLLMTSLDRMFLNLHPYWGENNSKALHQTIIRFPATRFIMNLPAILRGRPGSHLLGNSAYQSENVNESRLLFDGLFTLDGELIQAQRDYGPVLVSDGGLLTFLKVSD